VAVTQLAATQKPTQDAMGNTAVRSQMDARTCLRVRERRDGGLILGQGMVNAGWQARFFTRSFGSWLHVLTRQ
jgi:S-DNA-T family DNA segregation ATPase FtsK/SpoIIIE